MDSTPGDAVPAPTWVSDEEVGRFEVVERPEEGRFVLLRDGELVGFAVYRPRGDIIDVPYVETLAAHRGQGFGDRLMEGLLTTIRADGRRIVPGCHFAAQHIRERPHEHDLVAER